MTRRKSIVVIGGLSCCPKAAAKARRIDSNAEVVILQKEAIYHGVMRLSLLRVGGYFNDRNQLLTTTSWCSKKPDVYLKRQGH